MLESELTHKGPTFPEQNRDCVHKEEAEVAFWLVINKEGGTGGKTSTDTCEIRTVEVSMVARGETR